MNVIGPTTIAVSLRPINGIKLSLKHMKKYSSTNSHPRIDTALDYSQRKRALWPQSPLSVLKALGNHSPKSPLHLSTHNDLFGMKPRNTNDTDTHKISQTTAKTREKSNAIDKENILKAKKSLLRRVKDDCKATEKKRINEKVKELETKFVKMKEVIKKERKETETKTLESLVTKYRTEDLMTKTPALGFRLKDKKDQGLYYVHQILSGYSNSNNQVSQLAKTHLSTSLQLLQYTKKVPKPASVKPVRKLPKTIRKTIVFDLDETLIHCNDSPNKPSDIVLPIFFPTGECTRAGINIRPFARECLEELSQHFEIIVFTASHFCYANAVIDHLDPENKWVSQRFFREHCFQTAEGMYIKDLRVIDRPLKDLLLIDNVILWLFRLPTATASRSRTESPLFPSTPARRTHSWNPWWCT